MYSRVLGHVPATGQRQVLENDFVVVTGTGTALDFMRLLTVELH